MSPPIDREREGKLLSTLIGVLTASMCDPNRLSRGRLYARQGAVDDIIIEPGLITGFVQGSRARPYEVSVRVAEIGDFDIRGGSVQALVPQRREISFDCSCPDWDDPCKHAVAVMSAFADHLAEDPQQLAVWRGAPSLSSAPRATVGSRARAPEPEVVAVDPMSDTERAAMAAFLGAGLDIPTEFATPSPLPPPQPMWDEPWSSMLADALDAIAHGLRSR
jgi:hypothetical protein